MAALLALAALRCGGSRTGSTAVTAGGHSLVQWHKTEDAPKLAEASHKKILYDFNAAWCGPCKLLEETVFENPQAAQFINAHYIPVSVVDRQQEDGKNPPDVERLQNKYGIEAFPTLIIASTDGTAVGKMEGFYGIEATKKFLGD